MAWGFNYLFDRDRLIASLELVQPGHVVLHAHTRFQHNPAWAASKAAPGAGGRQLDWLGSVAATDVANLRDCKIYISKWVEDPAPLANYHPERPPVAGFLRRVQHLQRAPQRQQLLNLYRCAWAAPLSAIAGARQLLPPGVRLADHSGPLEIRNQRR